MWSGSSLRTAAIVLVAALLTCSGAQARSTTSARTAAGARALARVIDTGIEYRATPQVGLSAYIAHATPDRALESNYPGTAAGLFGFLEVRWRR